MRVGAAGFRLYALGFRLWALGSRLSAFGPHLACCTFCLNFAIIPFNILPTESAF